LNNILLISAVFPPEPVVSAKLSFDIANKLSEKDSVTVISPTPSRPFGFQFKGNTRSFRFKHVILDSFTCAHSSLIGRFKESYSFGKHCYRYIAINHNNIDVIYANTWPLFGQYFVEKAAKKYCIPVILHVQDIYPESLTNKMSVLSPLLNLLWLPIDKFVLRNSTRIIAISEKMKKYLVRTRKIDEAKVSVVQNWQDEELFIQYTRQKVCVKKEINTFTFMYLGNIGPIAGVDLLIDAIRLSKNMNCRLVIAGSGSMKESLEKKVNENGYSNIEFWSVPEGKVPEIQSLADVMILPIKKGSASSSVPSKLPAYMFSAKPIIACVEEDRETAAAINETKCGWVIPPENPDILASIIEKIIKSPGNTLKTYGMNGRNYALDNYSKKNNLPKLISIITGKIPS
jgi:glycosyltransferase involved in cell wall biosynthesis